MLPDCDNADIGRSESVTDNVVSPSELPCQTSHELYCFNLYDNVANDCIPLKQDSSDNNPMTEFNWYQHIYDRTNSRASVVSCGETNPHPSKSHIHSLCTFDNLTRLFRQF